MSAVEWLDGSETIITIAEKPWPWSKRELRRYRGSGTVWHDAETGKRQPTHKEAWLSEIWTKAKWERGT